MSPVPWDLHRQGLGGAGVGKVRERKSPESCGCQRASGGREGPPLASLSNGSTSDQESAGETQRPREGKWSESRGGREMRRHLRSDAEVFAEPGERGMGSGGRGGQEESDRWTENWKEAETQKPKAEAEHRADTGSGG